MQVLGDVRVEIFYPNPTTKNHNLLKSQKNSNSEYNSKFSSIKQISIHTK